MGHQSSKAGTIHFVTFICILYSLHIKFSDSSINNAHGHRLLTANLSNDMTDKDCLQI